MDRKDRNRIDLYCDNVVPKINMTKLWPKLLEHKIYNRDDVNIRRWTENLTAENTVKDIYLTIKTRGPKAFKNLLLSLRQTGHENIADILEGKVNNNNYREPECYMHHDVQRSPEPLKIKLRKAIQFLDRPKSTEHKTLLRYPMRSNPRGLVLIITNINYNQEKPRISAEHDETNLKELFTQMGFVVIPKRNLTGKQIKEEVKAFSNSKDLEKVDSCFVIVTSHGTEDENKNTEIQGVDYSNDEGNYEKVLCTDIMDYFTAEACSSLKEKPKIFIFQLCRGPKRQNAVPNSRVHTDTCTFSSKMNEKLNMMHPNRATRNYDDTLVVQSTLPGHVSYRDCINGSWFIQILCQTFMHHACENHILDLFSIVDLELKAQKTANNQCQTSCIKSIGFNKHCYLNPGLFEQA